MKKVSVVVPCYNVSAYLDKCMEYLLNQTIGIENIGLFWSMMLPRIMERLGKLL